MLSDNSVEMTDLVRLAADGIAVLDAEGSILYANPATETLLGRNSGDAIGSPLGIPSLGVKGAAVTIRRPDGTLTNVEMRATKTVWNGEPAYVVVLHDVSEREREFRHAQLLSSIVDSNDDAIIGKSVDGVITAWNAGAERLYGYTEEEAIGENIRIIAPENDVSSILEKIRRGESIDHYETVRRTKNGRRLIVSLTVSPIRDNDGNITGASTVARDVTEQHEAYARIEHLNRLLFATRNVNQIIVAEKDEKTLARKVCKSLVETRGYRGSCIALLDEKGQTQVAGSAGWNGEFKELSDSIADEWPPTCAKMAAKSEKGLAVLASSAECRECQLHGSDDEGKAVCVMLRNANMTLGFLTVTLREEATFDNEEESLLREVAGNVALALQIIEAEEARRRGEELLEETGDMARVGGWEINLDDNTVVWTSATKAIHETPEDYVPTLDEAIDFFPDAREEMTEAIRRAQEEGIPYDMELPFVTAKGNHLWTHVIGKPEMHDGRCVRLRGTFQDISARKSAEEQVKRERDYAERLIETIPAIVLELDTQGHIIRFNPFMERICGYSIDEVRGKSWFDTFPSEVDQENSQRLFESALTGNPTKGDINPIRTKTKEDRQIEWYDRPLKDTDGKTVGLLAVGLDVTERAKADEARYEADQRLRLALAAANIGLWDFYPQENRSLFSKEWKGQLGYGPDELSDSAEEWSSRLHPDDAASVTKILSDYIESGGNGGYSKEFRLRHKNGSYRWILTYGEAVAWTEDHKVARMLGCHVDITDRKAAEARIESLSRFPAENPNPVLRISAQGIIKYSNNAGMAIVEAVKGPDGNVLPVWQERVSAALQSDLSQSAEVAVDGRVFTTIVAPVRKHGYVNIYARDITDIQNMEAQLLQAQKLESIGTLAGGVAHEINNPINGIMNYAQLILDGAGEKDKTVSEFASEIIHETERVATLVSNLLSFARTEAHHHSPAYLQDIIEGTLSLVRTILRHDQIEVEVDIPDDLPPMRCRSQQIQQVLMNLITNARDALNEKYPGPNENKRLSLSASIFQKDDVEWVRTTVEDTGSGIPHNVVERIFDPFFTTKSRDKGTGLGLSISHGIIQGHHGVLKVKSEVGKWTCFHIDLPVDGGQALGNEEDQQNE